MSQSPRRIRPVIQGWLVRERQSGQGQRQCLQQNRTFQKNEEPNHAIERTADPRHASCGAGAAPRVAVRSWLTFAKEAELYAQVDDLLHDCCRLGYRVCIA